MYLLRRSDKIRTVYFSEKYIFMIVKIYNSDMCTWVCVMASHILVLFIRVVDINDRVRLAQIQNRTEKE